MSLLCSWDNYYQNDLDNQEISDDDGTEGDENDNDKDARSDDGMREVKPGDGDEQEEDDDRHPQLDPSELESWFDDVGAPAKTLAFLTSTSFPLSPNYIGSSSSQEYGSDASDRERVHSNSHSQQQQRHRPSRRQRHATVLDLGTGNGSALFSLRLDGGYRGRMVGVDYSRQSVELATRLAKGLPRPRAKAKSTTLKDRDDNKNRKEESINSDPESAMNAQPEDENAERNEDDGPIDFFLMDLIHDDPVTCPWWPEEGFDLVLDKGTFDAISLSSATIVDPISGEQRRVCELYPAKVARLVNQGGFLLVTSCNWTEDEVIRWFTNLDSSTEVKLEVYDRIKYPVFEFGGQKGQGVASVCFKRL